MSGVLRRRLARAQVAMGRTILVPAQHGKQGVLDRILVVGAGGQLGQALLRSVPVGVECVAATRAELDIADCAAVSAQLADLAPTQVINAAAYTAVDKAETEHAAARRGNTEGPEILAHACADRDIRLLHVSTDFVFDGSASVPYAPTAEPGPLGEYGRSKLAGEQAVMAALPGALIMRTGWVYSVDGSNFVKTMLRLMSERDTLSVVVDQVGTPTWAHGLASALWAATGRRTLQGVYHWSDAGVCSWYDFAVAIFEEGRAVGLLRKPVSVLPIPSAAYPTAARRPAYSVLDKSASWRDLALPAVHWRQQLRAMLADLKELDDV